jgi:hypothetical protein
VKSVVVERRVSPPPRLRVMLTFTPSLTEHMTQETGKRHNGAVAAKLAVRPTRVHGMDMAKWIPRLDAAAADTSYVIVCESFSPIHPSKQRFLGFRRPKTLALARQ